MNSSGASSTRRRTFETCPNAYDVDIATQGKLSDQTATNDAPNNGEYANINNGKPRENVDYEDDRNVTIYADVVAVAPAVLEEQIAREREEQAAPLVYAQLDFMDKL